MWREIFLSRAPTTSLSPSGVCAHLAGDAGLQFKTDSAVTSIKADRRWEGRPQACGEPGGGVAPGLRPASPPAAGHRGRWGVAPRGSGPATEAVGVSAATSGSCWPARSGMHHVLSFAGADRVWGHVPCCAPTTRRLAAPFPTSFLVPTGPHTRQMCMEGRGGPGRGQGPGDTNQAHGPRPSFHSLSQRPHSS